MIVSCAEQPRSLGLAYRLARKYEVESCLS